MNKIKSIGLTAIISVLFLGTLYIVPINKRKNNEVKPLANDTSILEDDFAQDTLAQNIQVEPLTIDEVKDLEPTVPAVEEKKELTLPVEQSPQKEVVNENNSKKVEESQEQETKKEEINVKVSQSKDKEKIVDTKKNNSKKQPETTKDKEKEKETPKKSQIGVDRKLISGIPGTNNYKGKLPKHNVKEKGSITITYVVDANGKVISAQRTGGLRSRTAINNAVTMVKKYVKAEKGKTQSTGTYTINFK